MAQKIGVLLLNMGGPEKQEDVRPFLYNLFSDRQIIRLGPALLQKPIAAMIARRRAPVSRANYQKIGGGSPLPRITAAQAQALEQILADDGVFIVRSCMRYWHPFADAVLQEMVAVGVTKLIALPLYPHYCRATTGSSFLDLRQHNEKLGLDLPVREIRSWPAEPEYIHVLVSRIREGLALFAAEEQGAVQLVYSAHSLPKKFIEQGDPYVEELKRTIEALEKQLGRQGRLCFQSRSGPVEWLGPSTPDMLKQLAEEGWKNILMVPLAFVSDHIETLYEIDMLYREQAAELGMRLESSRGLNDDPQFTKALRTLVLRAVDEEHNS
ncbi:MAG: ferrochelatase [Candidatus Electrothrix sp. GW3-4]|uniref:ferrochelatase n=1 Tax=Candidatus Electrothrix sp. GW3-4 TaxID=3126740 RepID=UPI0030D23822